MFNASKATVKEALEDWIRLDFSSIEKEEEENFLLIDTFPLPGGVIITGVIERIVGGTRK